MTNLFECQKLRGWDMYTQLPTSRSIGEQETLDQRDNNKD